MSSSPYIYGIHDPGGEALLAGRGWVVFTELVSEGGKDYRAYSNQGLGVIVRFNYSYGNGTLPKPPQYGEFAQACAAFVAGSQGCTTWIIGNEPNHAQEGAIPFDDYADGFNQAANAIRRVQPGATVCIAAVAPWNMDAGDWLFYFAQLVRTCHCGGITLHTYTHDVDPNLIYSDAKMASHPERHYEFKAYRDFVSAIPANKRHLPIYITETDQDKPWADVNSGWVQNAYAEIDWWNQQPGNPVIRCLALYRWPNHDKWGFCDKAGVQADLRAAVTKGFRWDTINRADGTNATNGPDTSGFPKSAATTLKVGDRVTVVIASVNVRNAPGLQAEVALRLRCGDAFVVEAIDVVDGLIWLLGPHGWCAEVAPNGIRLVDRVDGTNATDGADGAGKYPRGSYEWAFQWVVGEEGGLSTDRNDRGNWTGGVVGKGEFKGTKYGISAFAYPHLDIANLTLDDARRIYFSDYWQASKADQLPWDMALVQFDSAVQHHPVQALRFLADAGENPLLYLATRIRFYTRIDTWPEYGDEWMRRMANLLQEIGKED